MASAGSVVVSDDLKVELERYLDAVSVEARALLEGLEREYDVAWRLYRLSFDEVGAESRDVAHPLWLIWGHLTDLVDGPGGARPGAESAASQKMRRAAEEWLVVVNEPADWTEYFERWVYEECGYPRKAETP